MATGYEVDNWKNTKRIADALEKIAEELKVIANNTGR
jgi:hypothetical protein